MRRKKSVCIFLLCAVLLSSCSSGSQGNENTSAAVTETAEEVTSVSVTDDTGTFTESSTAVSSEITAESESETTSAAETGITGTSYTESTVSETFTEAPDTGTVTETSAAVSETETETTTAAEKPPVKVVIPEIKLPRSPGTQTASEDNAVIDYSNASEGYISAVYNGSSAAAKLRVKCGSLQYDHDLSTGGKCEYFPLMGNGDYTVSVYEQFSGKKYALLVSAEFSVTLKSDTGMYLYPNKYVDFDSSSECVKKAAELCAGADGDVEKIAAVFTYITDNVVYDKQLAATVKSGYVPHPDATLSSKKGICYDYASLFAAMCRSQGIPTRLVIGYAEPDIYHAWNEVYTDETGWITPELFLRNKGYNIADATFYAGNTDKEKISEYIADDSNYSAIYRY